MSTEEAGPTEIYGIYLSGKRTVRRTIVFSALFLLFFAVYGRIPLSELSVRTLTYYLYSAGPCIKPLLGLHPIYSKKGAVYGRTLKKQMQKVL